MSNKFLREEKESTIDYLLRLVGFIVDDKSRDIDWGDIVEYTGLQCHPDSLRKAFQPKEYGAYAIYKHMLDKGVSGEDIIRQLEQKKLELKKETIKFRDLRNGENERIRNLSRREAVIEEIQFAIDKLQPFERKEIVRAGNSKTTMICGIADAHFGKELAIEGFNGEMLNVYNEEIFYDRMWELLENYIEVIKEEDIKVVTFVDLSDGIEGILRYSVLQNLKYGAIESAIIYANFLATWLDEFSRYVEIDYYSCLGNHSETRILNSKSGELAKENLQYVIDEVIRLRLVNNDRVKMNETKSIQYIDANGFKILAVHGQQESNLVSSVKEYKEIYNIQVDLMISGHLHNSKQETASLRTKVIQFPSMIGIDDFSMKIKKTAKAEGKAILIKNNRFTNIDFNLQ